MRLVTRESSPPGAASAPTGAHGAGTRRGGPATRSRALDAGVVVALLAVYSVLQALYLRPPSSQDGVNYMELARDFPDVEAGHQSLRIGLLVPVRVFQTLFGYSEAAYYAVPLLAGAVLVVAVYGLGRLLFAPPVGTAAALFLMFSQPFLDTASVLLPDHVAGSLFALGLLLVVAVAHRSGASIASTRSDQVVLVAAGLVLAWAYLVREYAVFLFPVVVVAWWLFRLPWRALVWVAVPAAVVFAGELVLNGVLYGSPVERFVVSGGHGGQRDFITDSRLDALVRLPRALVDTPGAVPVAVALAAVPLALVVKDRGLRLLGVWGLAFWLPLTLGTGLVMPSFRFLIADKLRYWTPLFPAVALAAAALLYVGLRLAADRLSADGSGGRAGRVAVGVVVAVTAAAVGLAGSASDRGRDQYRVNGADQMAELRAFLKGPGRDVEVVWTDRFTARLVPLYARTTFGSRVWDGDVRAFDPGGRFVPPERIDRGVVVLHRFGYRILAGGYEGLPLHLRKGEPHWERVVERDDKSLVVFRVGKFARLSRPTHPQGG